MNYIIDTTLREGEQTPNVTFTLDQKKAIIDGLAAIGIEEIELGISSPLIECPLHLVDYLKKRYRHIRSSLWCRCKLEDIEHAAGIKPDILSLSIPVSDILIQYKLGKSKHWVTKQMKACIQRAHNLGFTVSIGFEDALRADREFVRHLAAMADQSAVHRIRLADTMGQGTPLQISSLFAEIKSCISTSQLAFHGHNDLGMATANSITAYETGADCVDATVLGLGERAGCTRLEEAAGWLSLSRKNTYDMVEAGKLAQLVAHFSNMHLSSSRPYIGNDIFICETGLHLHALQANLNTYQPYPPELIGKKHTLRVGAKAGRRALSHVMNTAVDEYIQINMEQAKTMRKILS